MRVVLIQERNCVRTFHGVSGGGLCLGRGSFGLCRVKERFAGHGIPLAVTPAVSTGESLSDQQCRRLKNLAATKRDFCRV